MSDAPQGPGWWIASDGRWYPPDEAPPVPPASTWATPPPGPPPRSGLSTGAIVALSIAAVVGLLAVLLGATLLLGTEASVEGDAGPADGFKVIQGDGIAVAVPIAWEQVTADQLDASPEQLAEAFPDADPAFLADFSVLFEQGAVLVAIDQSPAGGFASNINVLRAPGPGSLDALEPEVVAQLRSVGATDATVSRVDVPAGRSLRVEYSIGDAAIAARGVQLYVPFDGGFYVVSVTSGPDDDVGALADQIMETFVVTG
ncbi:MAG: hypothetical protein ABL966_04180 [Acidimicrobiales bacterium]